MANEFDIRVSVGLRNGNTDFQSRPNAFKADQENVGGPTPGQILVSTDGTDVDLSELTTPGIAWLQNLSEDYYVEVGIWDATAGVFYPFAELLPGEFYPLRLSRYIQQEFSGTGTADTLSSSRLRFKAIGGACKVTALVFEK
jgi:hypothetical protein